MVRPITGLQHSEYSEYLQTTSTQLESSLKSSASMISDNYLVKNSKKTLNRGLNSAGSCSFAFQEQDASLQKL